MAQIAKSVLFFDYDSVKRSLAGHGQEVADVFASRCRDWLAAIEDGSLLAPRQGDQVRRKLLVKRCYADPKALGEDRDWLTASGVQIVECPPFAGQGRSAAELHMALDASDAINHATGFNEFILLSADADLTPILFRLRAHDRSSIIYSNPDTEANYKALADGVLDERALIGVLIPGRSSGAKLALAYAKDETPAERPRKAERETAAVRDAEPAALPPRTTLGAESREELSALVRRLHQATRVPLFSPKTFAELFRFLADEVAENGYRFQTTAENVATKLMASGRKVTRRQVGFVVKGLALKGHTFSADDRPQDLAMQFRDQVLYLCKAANITLTDRELALLTAWVAGGASASQPAAPAPRVGVVERVRKSVVSRITGDPGKRTRGAAAAKLVEPEPEPEPEVEEEPEAPPQRPPRGKRARAAEPEPAEETKPAEVEARAKPEPESEQELEEEAAVEPVAEAAPAPDIAEVEPEAATEPEPQADATSAPQEEPEPAPARKDSRSAKPSSQFASIPDAPRMTPGRKPSLVGAKRASAARSAVKSTAPSRKMLASMPDADEVENSILAAIAEAVDVLVEDRSTDAVPTPKAENGKGPEETAAAGTPKAPVPPVQPDEDSDDIGDEIQRILASYSQGRNDR
jgi:hypothetical protein